MASIVLDSQSFQAASEVIFGYKNCSAPLEFPRKSEYTCTKIGNRLPILR